MKYLILSLLLSFSILSASPPEPNMRSVGFTSETMGLWGMLNVNYTIDDWSSDSDHYYVTAGASLIPLMGGVGFAWKHYFNSSRAAPFFCMSTFGTYILPVMCQTDDCSTQLGIITSGSFGYDFHLIQSNKFNLHLQIGILSQYDLINLEVFESPSDRPEIWPVFNLKFYK